MSLFLTVGCGGTQGAQPHDMSAAGHEAAANEHEQAAEAHASQYDAGASQRSTVCSRGSGCWTSMSNPTAQHLDEAEKHRKMAADHRAASQALRDAETQACVGLSDSDRDMSPFEHAEDIVSVEQLTTRKGAAITFRAVPGMTAPWLQNVIDCHIARNAALGHNVPEMPTCPLVPKGVTAKVTATNAGFAVVVQSDDSRTAQEIWRRAQLLKH